MIGQAKTDIHLLGPLSGHSTWMRPFFIIMPSASEILEFKVSNFNRVAAIAGGFLSIFGLVSYLLKEKFYLGEACM